MVDHNEDMKCFCYYHHYSNIKFDKRAFYLSLAMIYWRIKKNRIDKSDPQQMFITKIM